MKLESVNEFTKGTTAGAISAMAIGLFLEILEKLGLVKHCWLLMAGEVVMQFKHSPGQMVFSFILHLGVGGIWGVVIAFLFSKVFTDTNYLLKGLMIGLVIFFLHLGLLDQALNHPANIRQDTLTLFFIFLSYLIYGGLTTLIIQKWSVNNSNKKGGNIG